ncbi:hypothetical protein B0T22DRAFT_372049 [Podospora appendiculata]|uniref:3-beta hydroxysteroid dehydrogenase/isomerase domain-containing protein n=1 Tax=Podospora appendiculata TaxID=314037 RepID=A0AAE0XIZ7_9PEZI|nr:hypothetical protein B0T22DRAFT_372049 [Podospora appendiculata]
MALDRPFLATGAVVLVLVALYLVRLNQLMKSTPAAVKKVSPTRWTKKLLRETYQKLERNPVTTKSYANRLLPKLGRRYIVTGGSGLVGGYIVLQLLERGQPPGSIRIVDFRTPIRKDMLTGPASAVEFAQADISSAASTETAFAKPWPRAVAHLPLTVFHTAAIIVPSDRSKLTYSFCEAVNVRGTQHVVDASRRAGADVLVSTTSGSISLRPVGFWLAPWRMWSASSQPRDFWQVADEADFFAPPRRHGEYYANYPASKAAAERIVCAANAPSLRTGCIRPAHGVYGNPSDNTVGGPLNMGVAPTWTSHIVQSFVHGINAAVAHLQLEAVLAPPGSASAPQAGRPFTITDPNPPIAYSDLYSLIGSLAVTPFRVILLQPVVMLLISYPVECYNLLLVKVPQLRRAFPPLMGEVKHLQPALFSICTHVVATAAAASRRVEDGGIGYTGLLTTLEGMVQEVVEWNHEHQIAHAAGAEVVYQSSVALADDIQKATAGTS